MPTSADATAPASTDEARFSDLERRADGLLSALFFAVWAVFALLLLFRGGLVRNFSLLIGGVMVGVAAGLPLGRILGRDCAGGMFLHRRLRIALFVLALVGVGASFVLACFTVAPPAFSSATEKP